MHALEITSLLDDRISELAKNRLPDEPGYPSGNSHYASFMMPRDEMNINEKSPEKYSGRSNGNWTDDHKTKNERLGENSKNGFVSFRAKADVSVMPVQVNRKIRQKGKPNLFEETNFVVCSNLKTCQLYNTCNFHLM